jgi:ADP-ribosylglycohydrolase
MPSVIYLLMRHGHEPKEAIVRAVNDTKDNHTVASIVGAAVGALHGHRNLARTCCESRSVGRFGRRNRPSLALGFGL